MILSIQDNLDISIHERSTTTTLSENHIEKIIQICKIAWSNYFSNPLPGYDDMQVYCNGKLQFFHELNRENQIDIIKSSHVSVITNDELERYRSPETDISHIVKRIVLFSKGRLLLYHGIGHAVRAAIISKLACNAYFKFFREFENISLRTQLCSISASLLHDIGRCFGGDGSDIFGSTSAYIAGEILNEVGEFSNEEIEWIKEAIYIGGIDKDDVDKFHQENSIPLNEKQLIACIMGDADSFEFERFFSCDINYTSIKKLGILTKDGQNPNKILEDLKKKARELFKNIHEPQFCNKNEIESYNEHYCEILRNELLKLNQ